MTRKSEEPAIDRLRRQAETALRREKSRWEIEPLLERLATQAAEGTEHWAFAHRQLAELRLEQHPWQAALHLRKVVVHQPDDDVVHALMGLCQALLGNFHAAVASYRRALAIAPRNPWYHHNLGHLLDVALAQPDQALLHLRSANRMEPLEHEITASLAHCLACLDLHEEARQLADEAVRAAPKNKDHRALLAWIERGALRDDLPVHSRAKGPKARVSARNASPEPAGAVLQHLERSMKEAGLDNDQLERARALWSDFRGQREPRIQKPEVYAAAVEYALALVQGHGVTQAEIA